MSTLRAIVPRIVLYVQYSNRIAVKKIAIPRRVYGKHLSFFEPTIRLRVPGVNHPPIFERNITYRVGGGLYQ